MCLLRGRSSYFLGAFAELRNSTISGVMFVRTSDRMEQLNSQRTDFHKILHLSKYHKSDEETQISLKSDKINRYFAWRPKYIRDNISVNSSQNDKCFRQICTQNQNTHFVVNNFFFSKKVVYEIMWKNTTELGRPQMTI
jgi:hypothetical protein